jgi:hypothetical protein
MLDPVGRTTMRMEIMSIIGERMNDEKHDTLETSFGNEMSL